MRTCVLFAKRYNITVSIQYQSNIDLQIFINIQIEIGNSMPILLIRTVLMTNNNNKPKFVYTSTMFGDNQCKF